MFLNYETRPPAGLRREDPAAAMTGYLDRLLGLVRGRGSNAASRALFLRPEPEAVHEALRRAGFGVIPMTERAELAVEWPDFDATWPACPRSGAPSCAASCGRWPARRCRSSNGRCVDEDTGTGATARGNLIEKYGGPPDLDREARGLAALRTAFR